MSKPCEHIEAIERVEVGERACKRCVEMGGTWNHLRTCQTCGETFCCDSSPNKHARAHFQETDHPVIASAERGERWLYCYADRRFVDY